MLIYVKKSLLVVMLLVMSFTLLQFSLFIQSASAAIGDTPPATPPKTTGIGLDNPLGKNATISSILYNILNFLFYVSIPILAIMILWGGFQILTAGGEPEKAAVGKKTITYAIIGYAIVFISFGVEALLKDILSK